MERPTAPSPSASRVASVVAGLSRFSASQGLGATPPLCREMVEAYCAIGLARRASSTRGTYRSVLRAAAEKLERRPAVPYPGAPAPAPELGAMAARGLQYLLQEWWVPIMPGVAVFLLALCANLAGDALRTTFGDR